METQTTTTVTTTTAPVPAPASITWETYEYEQKDRHPDWVWYAGLIALLGAVLAFFFNNIFFGIFLVLAGIMVVVYAKRDPARLNILVNEKGVHINGEFIDYKNIKQFWLDETGKQDTLLLLVQRSFIPLLALPLEGVTRDQVHVVITGKIPEIEMHESPSVKIFDRLGF